MTTFRVESGRLPSRWRRLVDHVRTWHPAAVAAAIGAVGALGLSLVFTVVGLLLTDLLGVGTFESDINRFLVEHRSSVADDLSAIGSFFGYGLTIPAIALVTVVLLVRKGRWSLAGLIIVGLLVEVAVYSVTSIAVARDRPPVERLETLPTDSFPSGHVAASVVLYGALAIITHALTDNRRLRAAASFGAVAIPLAVAGSRLYRGVHFLSDVLAGLALGVCALATAVVAVRSAAATARSRSGT